MALDALLARITADAEAEALALLAAARAEARRLEVEAQALAGQQRDAALARVAGAQRVALALEVAGIEGRARAHHLETVSRILDEVLAAVREVLRSLPAARYRALLPGLLTRARGYLEGAFRAEARGDVADALQELLGTAAGVDPIADMPAGLRLRRADGRLVVDATFAGLMELQEARLRATLAQRVESTA